jgi:hypothetical protein
LAVLTFERAASPTPFLGSAVFLIQSVEDRIHYDVVARMYHVPTKRRVGMEVSKCPTLKSTDPRYQGIDAAVRARHGLQQEMVVRLKDYLRGRPW